MATTQISDIIEPKEFAEYALEKTKENSLFFSSGIANFGEFNTQANSGGRTVDMPFWVDLADTDSNVDDDDPAVTATPEKASSGDDIAFNHNRNKTIQGADLAAIVAGDDPLTVLANRFVSYWDREYQKIMINSGLGVLADNIANDASDMVKDIATDAAGAVTVAEQLTANSMVDAMQTMGDAKNDLAAIAIHSLVHANLQKQGALQDHFDIQTNALLFQTFMGKRVIVTDAMPAVAGANRVTYTSILFGAGAFGHGEGSPKVPVETDRTVLGGNGGGIETLVNRRNFILHPRGIKWVGGSVAKKGPTNAELKLAANFDRVYQRKNIRMAFVKTNG